MISVRAWVEDGHGRVLWVQRPATSRLRPGQWELPGGKLDLPETPEQAVLRELREETGIQGTVREFLGAWITHSSGRRECVLLFRIDARTHRGHKLDPHRMEWRTPEAAREWTLTPVSRTAIRKTRRMV